MLGLGFKDVESIDWKQELRRLYLAIQKPEKLKHLDEILSTWKGKEDAMLSKLLLKYNRVLPVTLIAHFNEIQDALQQAQEDAEREEKEKQKQSSSPFRIFSSGASKEKDKDMGRDKGKYSKERIVN